MNHNATKYIALLAPLFAALMCAACSQDSAMSKKIRGNYHFTTTDIYTDGIACDIVVETDQHFGMRSMNAESNVKLNFRFSDSFEFSNIELLYHISTHGRWTCNDSTILVAIDTSAVKCDFISSSAEKHEEKAMTRYLRKYVRDNFIPDIEQRVLMVGVDSICIDEVSNEALVLSFPITGRILCMKRKDEN